MNKAKVHKHRFTGTWVAERYIGNRYYKEYFFTWIEAMWQALDYAKELA